MPADVFCVECGEPLRAKFCGACGAAAGATGSPAAPTPAPAPVTTRPTHNTPKKQWRPWIYAVGTLAIVISLVLSADRNEGDGAAVILFDALLAPISLIGIAAIVGTWITSRRGGTETNSRIKEQLARSITAAKQSPNRDKLGWPAYEEEDYEDEESMRTRQLIEKAKRSAKTGDATIRWTKPKRTAQQRGQEDIQRAERMNQHVVRWSEPVEGDEDWEGDD
jgi:hypothetical protein